MRKIDVAKKWVLKVCLASLIVLSLSSHAVADSMPMVNIGILADASSQRGRQLQSLFEDELEKICAGEFSIQYPESKQINGQWSFDEIKFGLNRLQNDPEVDLVLILGLTGARIAADSKALNKPTFVPFLYGDDLFTISETGNENFKKNLNYLRLKSNFENDIQTFLDVISFTNLAILVDELHFQACPEAVDHIIQVSAGHGVSIEFILNSDTNENLVEKIPDSVEAVMITPLPRLCSVCRDSLVNGLVKRKLPGFSYDESISAENGVLMSSAVSSDMSKRARRLAINIKAVLNGKMAEAQPVELIYERGLTINMATGRAIDVYPKFNLLRQARVLYPETGSGGPALTLCLLAKEAVRANLAIIAGQLGVSVVRENIAEARSVLFPQIVAGAAFSHLNDDNQYVEIGYSPEKSTAGSIRLEQVVFSERALANLAIAKHFQAAKEAQQRGLELDIVAQASTAFLNVLISKTNVRIQEDNLDLTQKNLQLAENRVQAGLTDAADIYRWESEIALARQNVLKSMAAAEQTQDALNRILHRPLKDRFVIVPATLDDPALLISRKELLNMVCDGKAFELTADFFITEGLAASTDLMALNAQISAKVRQNESDCRAYWAPEVFLFGEVSHVFDETREPMSGINLEDATNWETGIKIVLPMYEGGARNARKLRSAIILNQLKINFSGQEEIIAQMIRKDLYDIHASYPAIALSCQSATAARKSFELIRENYIQGTRSITDLLVSQNANLTAEQSAANAVYRFLLNLMSLQRDIGEFDFFTDDIRQDKMILRLKAFIADGSGVRSVDQIRKTSR